MILGGAAQSFEVCERRCLRCGQSYLHYRPEAERGQCDATGCVCSGCGRLYCLSLWQDRPTHEALRAIGRRAGWDSREEAALLTALLPKCACGCQIVVCDDRCPACGSSNHVTLGVRRESQTVGEITLDAPPPSPARAGSMA